MIEHQPLLVLEVEPFVGCDDSSLIGDLDLERCRADRHLGADEAGRDRIAVGLDPDARLLVHGRLGQLGDLEALGGQRL